MKKRVLISCFILVIVSISAFAFINNSVIANDPTETDVADITTENLKAKTDTKDMSYSDFSYDVGPRFGAIKKSKIDNTTSIHSFFSEDKIKKMASIKSVEIIVIENNEQSDKRKMGINSFLTIAQINLLKSFDYSTNFLIRVDYKQKNKETGNLEDSYSTPHHTIVPEVQAAYIYGKKSLIKYLRDNTIEAIANTQEDKLQPAKLFFTITQNGTVSNVKLDRSSGYPEIDELITRLITSTPGGWIPAINSQGENVNQELVVSFGLMGC